MTTHLGFFIFLLVGGFNPSEKYSSKWVHLPQVSGFSIKILHHLGPIGRVSNHSRRSHSSRKTYENPSYHGTSPGPAMDSISTLTVEMDPPPNHAHLSRTSFRRRFGRVFLLVKTIEQLRGTTGWNLRVHGMIPWLTCKWLVSKVFHYDAAKTGKSVC